MTSSTPRAAIVLAIGVLVLAGCASGGTGDEPATPSTSTPSASTPPPAATPSVSSSASREMTTLSGTLTEGVEAGCTLLTAGGKVYQLVGADVRRLRPGPVTVRGYVAEGLLSYCQQGTPFRVVAVDTQ
jgi:hypothetical protein